MCMTYDTSCLGYLKDVLNIHRPPQAKRDIDGSWAASNYKDTCPASRDGADCMLNVVECEKAPECQCVSNALQCFPDEKTSMLLSE